MSHATYDIVILRKSKMREPCGEIYRTFSIERGGEDAKKTKAPLFSSWLPEFDRR